MEAGNGGWKSAQYQTASGLSGVIGQLSKTAAKQGHMHSRWRIGKQKLREMTVLNL